MLADEIKSGESIKIEFKVEVPKKSEKYIKSVIAFANTAGGKIVIGVDDETHEIIESMRDEQELLDEYYLQVMRRGFNRLSPHMQNILISLLQNHVSPVEVYDSLRQKFPEFKKDFKSGLNKDEKIEFINRVKGKALKIWESYCPTKIM